MSECGSVWVQVPGVCQLFVTVLTVSDRGPHGGLQRLTRESLHLRAYVCLKLLYNGCATSVSKHKCKKKTNFLPFISQYLENGVMGVVAIKLQCCF